MDTSTIDGILGWDSKVVTAILSSLASKAAVTVGTRVATGVKGALKKDSKRDLLIAATLDSNSVGMALSEEVREQITGCGPRGQAVAAFLQSTEVASITHELLLSSLVETDPDRLNGLDELFRRRMLESCGKDAQDTSGWIEQASEKLFDLLTDECIRIAENVAKETPDVAARIKNGAALTLIADTLDAVRRHLLAFTPGQFDHRSDSEYRKLYRKQLRTFHGTITPPDFDQRREVPLEDLYVSPEIGVYPKIPGHPIPTEDIYSLWDSADRVVLLGEPGGGKSTATGALIWRSAADDAQTSPYLVTLRDYAPLRQQQSIVKFIESRLGAYYQCEPPDGYVERSLLSGQGAVFFDGLDELLDTAARRDVTDIVQGFASKYPLIKILVTSRLVGYNQAPMNHQTFRSYRIASFTDTKVAAYVERWFSLDTQLTVEEARSQTTAFLSESSTVEDLRSNPLMLALMCIIYRGQHFIPRNRPAIYERCATLLFETWDKSRQITPRLSGEEYIDDTLKHLALWLLQTDSASDGVTREILIAETTRFFKDRAFEDASHAAAAAKEFVDFCRGRAWVFSDAGTTAEGEELFKFTHRTFMEYFAAYELTRLSDSPARLAKTLLAKVAKQEWDMVGQLAVQIHNKQVRDGSARVLQHMLDDRVRRTNSHRSNVLAFITRCLAFASVPPSLVRSVTRISTQCSLGGGMEFFTPMHNLASVQSESLYRLVVEEAVSVAIEAAMGSNTEARLAGMEFVLLLHIVLSSSRSATSGPSRSNTLDGIKVAAISQLSSELEVSITEDRSVLYSAVQSQAITLDRFLTVLDSSHSGAHRSLDFLFVALPHRPFGFFTAELGRPVLRGAAVTTTNDDAPTLTEALVQFIVGTIATTEPPWVSAAGGNMWLFGITDDIWHSRNAIDSDEFPEQRRIAAAVVLCIFIELYASVGVDDRFLAPRQSELEPPTSGKISAAVALARAGNTEARELIGSTTWIPEIVKSWCENAVNFCGTGEVIEPGN